MKKLIYISIASLLFLSNGFSQSKTIISKWHSDRFNLNNKMSIEDYYYDSDQKIFYGISNDLQNIYVTMRFVDKEVQKKVLMLGLTTWIDKTAKNKKNVGIKFPLKKDPEEFHSNRIEMSHDKQKDNSNLMLEELIAFSSEIELIGFEGKKSSDIIPVYNSRGIKADLKVDEKGDLLYRLTIPIFILNTENSLEDIRFSINVVSETPDNKDMSHSKPGGSGRGMSGRPPGGGGGGGGGNRPAQQQGMNEKSSLSSPIKISIKSVKLSLNN